MKTVIVYPVPMETPEVWAIFKPMVERFAHSMKNTAPGCDYEIVPVINHPTPTMAPMMGEFEEIFNGLPSQLREGYIGKGADVGSYQLYAEHAPENTFMVCMSTRCYAWKAGWLKPLVQAREIWGTGLYTTSISKESGKTHACCRCFGVDSDDFKRYPTKVISRDQAGWFECGGGCLLDWYKNQNLPARVVHWEFASEINDVSEARCWAVENCYRRGDQSNLLVKDKHSLIYDEATPERKKQLEDACFLGTPLPHA